MSKVVPADIDINKEIATGAIFEAFNLEVKKINLLGEGWDNLVYLVNGELVFRFSRRKVALPLIKREMWVLKQIAPKLPLAIPVPSYTSEGTKTYPYSFYGHQILTGISACQVSLKDDQYKDAASKLGNFLKTLHKLDHKKIKSLKDPMQPVFDRVDIKRMLATFTQRTKDVESIFNLKPYTKKISEITDKAQSYVPKSSGVCLVHGDLYHRHLIFSKNFHLTGIIDWGDACVSDPVIDLGVLFQFFPKRFHDDFWKSYGKVTEPASHYARFLGLYSSVALLWYGHDKKDKSLIETSLKTLEMI